MKNLPKGDAQYVADILNLLNRFVDNPHPEITAEDVERMGFAYAFTELTPDEAKQVGALAYMAKVEVQDE